jgi:hypothetical protein
MFEGASERFGLLQQRGVRDHGAFEAQRHSVGLLACARPHEIDHGLVRIWRERRRHFGIVVSERGTVRCHWLSHVAVTTPVQLSVTPVIEAEPAVSGSCPAPGETQKLNQSTGPGVFRCGIRLIAPPGTLRRKMFAGVTSPANTARRRDRPRVVDRAAAGESIPGLSGRGHVELAFECLAEQFHHGNQQRHW